MGLITRQPKFYIDFNGENNLKIVFSGTANGIDFAHAFDFSIAFGTVLTVWYGFFFHFLSAY